MIKGGLLLGLTMSKICCAEITEARVSHDTEKEITLMEET